VPFPRKKTPPNVRLGELLAGMKRALLQAYGEVTAEQFEQCWDAALEQVRRDRCFPDDRLHRQQWQRALDGTKGEWRACFLGEPTAYSEWQRAVMEGSNAGPPRLELDGPDVIGGRAVA
jgi:hypothetical protein